jgi:putative Mg2+ transporter-C (MgtC) family protein
MTAFWHSPIVGDSGRLLLALLLGSLVGWERERHDHPAGLRTHALVCVGAALITLVGNSGPDSGGRVAAQIVTGIGFLGAGTILRDSSGSAVRGLTTAASIWATAGIGIAIGYGGINAQLAAVATGIVLLTLTVLNQLEDFLNRRRRRQELTLVFSPDADALSSLSRVLQLLHERDARSQNISVRKSADSTVVSIQLRLPKHTERDAVEPILTSDNGIIHFEWKD